MGDYLGVDHVKPDLLRFCRPGDQEVGLLRSYHIKCISKARAVNHRSRGLGVGGDGKDKEGGWGKPVRNVPAE